MAAYYILWPMSDNPSEPTQAWLDQFLGAYGFSCLHYDLTVRPSEVVLKNLGEDVPYNFVNWPSIDYLRSDLLEALSPEAESFLSFGTLSYEGLRPIANLKTIRGGACIYLRGGKEARCWRCNVCGQLVYDPITRWHILSCDIPHAPLFLTHYGGIVINEELRERLSDRRWKKLSIDRLTVRDEPIDGFPLRLNDIAPDDERRPLTEDEAREINLNSWKSMGLT